MLYKFLENLEDESPNLPNKYAIDLGDHIRGARLEAGLSQSDLVRKSYFANLQFPNRIGDENSIF